MNQLLNLEGREFAVPNLLNIWVLYYIATLNFCGILSKKLEGKNIYIRPSLSCTGRLTVKVKLLIFKQKIRPLIVHVFPI